MYLEFEIQAKREWNKSQSKKQLKRDFSSKIIGNQKLANMKTPPQEILRQDINWDTHVASGCRNNQRPTSKTGLRNEVDDEKTLPVQSKYWGLNQNRASRGNFLNHNAGGHVPSYNSLRINKESKTTKNSQSTTPYPEWASDTKSSEHFLKIVNKFQNVFKKEKSESSQTRHTLKVSHSKPNLKNESNFIWKRFEDQLCPPKNIRPGWSIETECDSKNKPVRSVYGKYTEHEIEKELQLPKQNMFVNKYVVPRHNATKDSSSTGNSRDFW